ncbi:MAG TPA: hypothetical protein PKN32_04430 [Bacteroidales bacterium]|nr:hypothetical protein [Bacteroidales bacterium]
MKIKIFLIIGLLFIITKVIHSQTPGLIFEPAGSVSGREVLDPNGDGYVSSDNSGFTFHDRTESEIPFIPLIFPGTEPNSDLESGPSCGFTDFVESLENDPAQNYLDNNGNWIFRLRMANVATNAKSYSILIDANELFGPNDPNYTANNPGFELEIVLATKFGVFVYDHRATNPNPCIPVISYLGTSNYQKAIAFSTICGSTNYFLDFFVKMEDITLKFNYDETTNFRIAISSNAAANKSSICSLTSISDLGGVTDQCGSLESCFTNIVENQVPCPPEDVNSGNCQAISATPVITSPIGNESVSVSGTSSDADSTIIEIYIDGILVGSAYVIDGFWEILGLSPLISDQIITARAKASTKAYSDFSEPVIVGSTCSVEVSSASYCGKGIQGTSNLIGAIIRVYQGNSTTPMVPSAGTQWNTGSFITVNSSGAFIWKKNSETGEKTVCNSGGGNQITNGAYRITQQESSKCESDGIWICVGTPGTTATPSITTSPITSSTESISGTISNPDNLSGVTIFVYINGSQEYTTTTTSGGAWTLPDISLSECDVITVRALNTSKCISDLSSEYSVQGPQTSPPVITGEYCTSTNITTVTGTSAEADGTLIQILQQ